VQYDSTCPNIATSISHSDKKYEKKLEQADRLAHGAFDVEGFNVLPVLFKERNKEVDA